MLDSKVSFAAPIETEAAPASNDQCENMACLACPGRCIGLCGDIGAEELGRLFQISARLSVPSGHELIRQGEPSRHVQFVVAGGLMLSRVATDGRRFVAGFAWPSDLVGLVNAESSADSAFAMGPTEVCRFPHSAFDAFVAGSPRLAHRLIIRAHELLADAQDHMVSLGCGSAREKVASFLARTQQRQGRLLKVSPTVNLPMRRFDVAAHLGLTVETVSRVFQDFVRRKIIIVIPDGVRILSAEKLKAVAFGGLEDASLPGVRLAHEAGAGHCLPPGSC